MTNKLIISNSYKAAAIVYKNEIQKCIVIHRDYQVGDIYLGIINKIFQGINAAFVHLHANRKSGFIHINDSGPLKRQSNINSVTDVFSINQRILVQVIKEPTIHKGPKLTANIALSGQYMILIPFNQKICIDRGITNQKQRYALKALAFLLKPLKMGLLFRQCSAGVSEDILFHELTTLRTQWNFINKSTVVGLSPCLIYRNNNIIKRILHSFYDHSINDIIVDSSEGLSKLKLFFQKHTYYSKYHHAILKSVKINNSSVKNSDVFFQILRNLDNCIKLPLGGYILIETSETLTTIDVNSGSFNKLSTPRETVLTTNCLAATEIGNQLLKRNITGIIIIDFINMRKRQDLLNFLKHFSQVLQKDHTQPQIIQLSELGLVEVIRQRIEKSLIEVLNEYVLSTRHGTYKNKTLQIQTYDLYNKLYKNFGHISTVKQWTNKKNSNSIFFKKVFPDFCYIIYKRKHIYNISIIDKYDKLLNTSIIYFPKYRWTTSTTFLYKNTIYSVI